MNARFYAEASASHIYMTCGAAASVTIALHAIINHGVEEREAFRQISYVRLACVKTIIGHGTNGYLEAIDYLIEGK